MRRALGAASLLLAAACGGGGSSSPSAPALSVAFVSSGTVVNEDAGPLAVQVVLHSSVGATTDAITVNVVDVATGTATSGVDYTAFAPQTVTFPVGSVDGDTQSVTLTPVNDMNIEGANETVRLALSDPDGAAVFGTSQFQATIGEIHRATIQFAAPSSATPNESSSQRTVTVSLDLPNGVSLGTTAGVRVTDVGNGSASSGVDYATFAPANITFPPGSADGSTQSIVLQVIDDSNIEINESVRFNLSSTAASTLVGSTGQHLLSITDDDATSSAAFAATAGPTGTENVLVYDQQLDLGTQTVGQGSNTGTRVRVSNTGGAPMSLAAPRITGTDANDFDVEVEIAPLPPPAPMPSAPGPEIVSPLLAGAPTPGPGLALALDADQVNVLRGLDSATLVGFPVPGMNDVALEVSRVALPIAPDAVLKVDGVAVAGGLREAVGDLTLWSGVVRDQPGSHVFLALSSSGSRGYVDLGFAQDTIVHVVPDANSPAGARVVREAEVAALGLTDAPESCAAALEVPGSAPQTSNLETGATPPTGMMITADCRVAIETDYQLYQKFGSTLGVTTYVTQLMAAVSDRYFHDVQTTLSIAYLGVYSNASDPWTSQDSGGTSSDLLGEFRSRWAPNNWPAAANLAHFISGASLGGGVAYVNVLCNQSFGFGVSGNVNGTINWGTWTAAPGAFTWDFVVVAHEIGHNFGSQHTHSFCPPLDRCYSNCTSTTSCTRGTIMSYCHTCGGMSNIDLEFHPVCSNVMRQAVNASCIGQSALGSGEYVQYRVRFNPLTSTGARNAMLEFGHDAPNEAQPFRVRLQGTAN